MTKRKKSEKQETPPPNKTDGRSSKEQPGEESIVDTIASDISDQDEKASSEKDSEPELDEPDVVDPKFEVLSRGIDAWIFSRFTPFFYHLTRAFAHFQKGTPMTTQKIFQNLEWIGQGDHEKFMRTLDEFKALILEEYLEVPDGRIVPVADIRPRK